MEDKIHRNAAMLVVRRLALFMCCVLLFEGLLIAVAPRLHSSSVLKIAKDSVLLRVGNDSSYYMAQGDLAWRQHPNAIYETAFFQRGVRFIYPPTSLLLYRAWQAAARVHVSPYWAMNFMLILSMLATWLLAVEFFLVVFGTQLRSELRRKELWQIRGLIAVLVLVFLPLINAYHVGQVQTLLTAMLVVSVVLWARGHRKSVGVLVGLTCWLKPQMALFLIWGLARKRWNFAVSLLITLLVGLALSLAVFGVHNTVEYVHLLSYLSRRGDALATNQSLNGLLHRVMHVGSPVTWIYGYPPFNRTIYIATLASSAITLLLALIVPVRRGFSGRVSDFLVFAMATTMASPIAWEHHYGVFFLAFLLLMPDAFKRWKTFVPLLCIYLLMTDTWAPLHPLMFTRWTFSLSHVYFGGLLLFVWMLFGCPRLRSETWSIR